MNTLLINYLLYIINNKYEYKQYPNYIIDAINLKSILIQILQMRKIYILLLILNIIQLTF